MGRDGVELGREAGRWAGGGRWLTDDKIAWEQLRNRPLMEGNNPDKRSII